MIKSTNYSSRAWNIMDEERGGLNPAKWVLYGNGSGGEENYTLRMDVLSNGFKIRPHFRIPRYTVETISQHIIAITVTINAST